MRTNERIVTTCVLLSVLVAGCAPVEAPSTTTRVALRIEGDPGERVAGAEVYAGATRVAVSDDQGTAALSVRGHEGQAFDVTVRCPDGYRSPPAPIAVRSLAVSAPDALAEYVAHCPRTRHALVVGVRASRGANLPVLYLGREVARTDESGAATVLVEMSTNDHVELTLATTDGDASHLHPQNPSAVFEMHDRDAVEVFEVLFTRDTPRPRAQPHRDIVQF